MERTSRQCRCVYRAMGVVCSTRHDDDNKKNLQCCLLRRWLSVEGNQLYFFVYVQCALRPFYSARARFSHSWLVSMANFHFRQCKCDTSHRVRTQLRHLRRHFNSSYDAQAQANAIPVRYTHTPYDTIRHNTQRQRQRQTQTAV